MISIHFVADDQHNRLGMLEVLNVFDTIRCVEKVIYQGIRVHQRDWSITQVIRWGYVVSKLNSWVWMCVTVWCTCNLSITSLSQFYVHSYISLLHSTATVLSSGKTFSIRLHALLAELIHLSYALTWHFHL